MVNSLGGRVKQALAFTEPWKDETELRGAVVLPTENPQNQVENKKGTQQNERDKVKPGPLVSDGIIHLEVNIGVNTNNSHSQQRKFRDLVAEAFTDPVEYFGPSLHGNALIDCKHGEADVVEVRDAVIGSLPAGPALGAVDGAAASVASLSAGCRQLPFRCGVDICAPNRPSAERMEDLMIIVRL